ncbi:MAG TPA: hypothetical protein VF160_11240 [Candidatus Dormibacteraeota bacterium]
MPDIRVSLSLDGQLIPSDDVADTIDDLTEALREVESAVTGQPAKVVWRWDQEAAVPLVASSNGVPEDALRRIVFEVDAGFQTLAEAKGNEVRWPVTLSERARQSIEKIVRRLDQVESIHG